MLLFMHGQTTTNYTVEAGNCCYFKENPQCIQDKSNIYFRLVFSHTDFLRIHSYYYYYYVRCLCLMTLVLGDEMKIACQP